MFAKSSLLVAAIGLFMVFITGCGGGSPGPDTGGGDPVSLTISADTDGASDVSAPLDPGAIVTVYNFRTGTEITKGTLVADGTCKVDVSSGLTVVVVITGVSGGKTYRLSTIIPSTPPSDTAYEANPATSIAAEAIAQKYFKEQVISQDTLDTVLPLAEAYVSSNPGADYSLSGTLITGAVTDFGNEAGLDDALDSIVSGVPDETNGVALAKQAIQQIKEAGIPIKTMVNQERPDVEGIFGQAVKDKYTGLGNRLDTLIAPAMFGDWEFGDDWDISVFDLTLGRVYEADSSSGWLELTDAGSGTAGQIRITLNADGDIYTLVAAKSGSAWTITQTFSGDPSQLYRVTIPEVSDEPGSNPAVTGTISIKDNVFTTPLTFSGTLSATGPNKASYTKIVFNGTLTTPNVSSAGRFEINFPASKPAGATDEDVVYDFPTSFSMTNANITVTGEGTTVALTGSISITAVNIILDVDGELRPFPKTVEMTGTYSNSHSGLGFDGSITANWSNPATDTDETPAKGTVNMDGEMTREGHPTYYADLKFTLDSGTATCEIDLREGSNTLNGTATATITHDGVTNASMDLENQSGVTFSVSDEGGTLSGDMKVGGTKVADISESSGLIRIDYTGGTYDEF